MGGLVGLRDRLGVCYTGRLLASFGGEAFNRVSCRCERGVFFPAVLPGRDLCLLRGLARSFGDRQTLTAGSPERRVEVGSHPTRLETRTKESNMCASRRVCYETREAQ